MQIYRTEEGAIIKKEDLFYFKEIDHWDAFINRKNLHKALMEDVKDFSIVDKSVLQNVVIPMGTQEIWASGVTYMRSKEARMEESKKAGGGTFYDRVYDAERPELFFKATPQRTVGDGGTVRIRKDSGWDVPEPELTLFISSEGTIEGYTIGNDMSSRSIEGENPLYLPQAKTYEGCAGLGPCIYVPEEPIDSKSKIRLEILRKNSIAFSSEITIDQMKRKHSELVDFLFRECNFPKGCFLMTGTGIIPPDEFTLLVGDEIRISIDHIGTLVNFVGQ
ncbi:fumarylacetoacetate hydrolase family protein [Ulvibacterium marinum]|uniref:2-hydroxyhepta-2,4-diene-1,7-dioate isomerase n=1 Tax=Ulvibacterium marinum TaxID=2419782 RepID=A0A3B0C478_9FLAO|nr:fumarylacetoacetate hydrolase family protein [Ulvibacterium marinum]RKN80885.1 2-hydroxyhepta-2,4-diene-1,7-dioate isomerase [Ulvibacterium marinum]